MRSNCTVNACVKTRIFRRNLSAIWAHFERILSAFWAYFERPLKILSKCSKVALNKYSLIEHYMSTNERIVAHVSAYERVWAPIHNRARWGRIWAHIVVGASSTTSFVSLDSYCGGHIGFRLITLYFCAQNEATSVQRFFKKLAKKSFLGSLIMHYFLSAFQSSNNERTKSAH